MAIRGDLLAVDLSNVFQMLAMNRKHGVLTIQNRDNILEKRELVLDEDRVAVLHVPGAENVNALLVEMGEIDFATFADAREKAISFGLGPTQYLQRKKSVDAEMLRRAVKRLQEEAILEIFLWRNVTFDLDEGAPIPEHPDRTAVIVDHIIMEAARRQDEWRRVVDLMGGGTDIFAATGAEPAPEAPLDDVSRIVLTHLNGVAGSREVVRELGLPRYHVDSSICGLFERGLVKKLGRDDLIEQGDRETARGAFDDAIRLFKCAARFDRRSIEIHRRLGEAYRAGGRLGKAASHMKFSGLILAQHGNLDAAIAEYQDVCRMLPTDFKALERCLDWIAKRGGLLRPEDRATVEEGVKLFGFYFDSKLYEPAESLIQSLLAILKDDLNLGFAWAKLLGKTGRMKESAEQYMRLASRLVDLRDDDGAVHALKLAESVDGSRHDAVQLRLQQIRDRLERRKKRRSTSIMWLAFLALGFVAAAAYAWYWRSAARALHEVERPRAQATEADWRAAADRYRETARHWPFTRSSLEARAWADDADRCADEAARRGDDVRRRREEEHAEIVGRAARRLRAGVEAQNRRDLEGAAVAVREALALANEASARDWLAAEKPEELLKALEAAMARESADLAAIERLSAEGKNEDAWRTATSLLADAERADLDTAKIRVLSKPTLEKLRVPLLVESLPPGAEILIGSESVGRTPGVVRVPAASGPVSVTLRRDGHRDAVLELDRKAPGFRRTAVLERAPDDTKSKGRRVAQVLAADAGAWLVYADGGAAYQTADAEALPWTWRPEGVNQIAEASTDRGTRLALATVDGRVVALDAAAGVELMSAKGFAPIAPAIAGAELVAVSDTLPARLVFLDIRTGRELGAAALDGLPHALRAAEGRVFVLKNGGGAEVFDVKSRALVTRLDGPYGDFAASIGRRFVALRADGGFDCIDPASGKVEASVGGRPWSTQPGRVGDKIGAVAADGSWVMIDARGMVTTSPERLPLELLKEGGRVLDAGASALIEGSAGALVRVRAADGRVLGAVRSVAGAVAFGGAAGSTILVGHSDGAGTVDFYRGE